MKIPNGCLGCRNCAYFNGGIKSIFVNYNKASDFLKEQFMREVRRAWDDSAITSVIGALQIAAQKPQALEGKNEK